MKTDLQITPSVDDLDYSQVREEYDMKRRELSEKRNCTVSLIVYDSCHSICKLISLISWLRSIQINMFIFFE